jgi:ketosteroid isomerase-like protein
MNESPGTVFYERQVALLEAGDVDGLVEHQFHEDATLISFDVTRRGREALRRHFRDYLQSLGSMKVVSTDKLTETDDALFFEATIRTDHGTARAYNVFMLRAGKATHLFTGLISFEPTARPGNG